MDKDNPAVYECPKGKNKLHTWKRWGTGAFCVECGQKLNAKHAMQVFEGVG